MLRIHSNTSRSFICEQCGKGFKVKSDLQHHMKTHGEKSLPCNLCELKFRDGFMSQVCLIFSVVFGRILSKLVICN